MTLTDYDKENISTFERLYRAPSIADAAVSTERQLYQFVQDHISGLRVAIANYNAGVSVNPKIDWNAIADILSDEVTSPEAFDERLSDARFDD